MMRNERLNFWLAKISAIFDLKSARLLLRTTFPKIRSRRNRSLMRHFRFNFAQHLSEVEKCTTACLMVSSLLREIVLSLTLRGLKLSVFRNTTETPWHFKLLLARPSTFGLFWQGEGIRCHQTLF